MSINEDSRYFRTSSFYVACFLFAKGLVLVDIDRTVDFRRAQFVFIDSPEREPLIQSFNFAKDDDSSLMVDARKFVVAIKQLKEKLYQEGLP